MKVRIYYLGVTFCYNIFRLYLTLLTGVYLDLSRLVILKLYDNGFDVEYNVCRILNDSRDVGKLMLYPLGLF